ncbi:MAG: hypothetical protein CL605_00180 [Altibacter sp.]|uniref:hypothetical protein n=1 Tax=Altibacter sp. TaxID=2024823 RepID=UPI000C8D16A1|nr:hypothetical protein [Altibacter sp.]MAP53297.1 hypothetical protein [Altibacter sp.]
MMYKNWHGTMPDILHTVQNLGYKIFTTEDFDLNIVGVRSSNRRPGFFDDMIVVCYKSNSDWIEERYKATTDPSMEQHRDPDNPKGVAVLKPGQYRGVYKIDKHAGKYQALCQRGAEVTVYRDNNRDERTDYINEESGYFGINLHRAHQTQIVHSTQYFSHGCQVIQNPADFARLMGLAFLQIGIGYDSFTYTLIESKDMEL